MEKAFFVFLAALMGHFATTTSSVATNNTKDLDALLAFKAAILDPQNILPINWSTSTSFCNWIGISCNTRHQRVSAIDLANMGLVGTVPPQFGNLSFLVWLNLENNSFHGNPPTELSRLRRLKYISLAWNDFEGGFPSWFGALTELRLLSCHDNKFSGSLSMSKGITNATKLETFGLSYNLLSGTLPEEFSALQNLKVLDLGFNQLTGAFPRALLNLSMMQKFSFASNNLSGYLPASICSHLPLLELIHLSSNEFHGKIPSSIGDCSRLQILSLSDNKLSGTIPREIWNVTALWWIHLGENHLEDQDMVGHVSDFGIAKLLADEESVVQTKTLATFGYIAPEYGLEGLVSTRCDIYSFGITLMETFTRKRPKDEMFTEELTIRRWIQESLPDSINQVIDVNLLKYEDEPPTKMVTCVLSILQLALTCTTDAPDERINIKDVLVALDKIKRQFLQTNKKS